MIGKTLRCKACQGTFVAGTAAKEEPVMLELADEEKPVPRVAVTASKRPTRPPARVIDDDDDDDEQDRPRRRSRKRAQASSNSGLVVGGVVGGVLLAVVLSAATLYFAFRKPVTPPVANGPPPGMPSKDQGAGPTVPDFMRGPRGSGGPDKGPGIPIGPPNLPGGPMGPGGGPMGPGGPRGGFPGAPGGNQPVGQVVKLSNARRGNQFGKGTIAVDYQFSQRMTGIGFKFRMVLKTADGRTEYSQISGVIFDSVGTVEISSFGPRGGLESVKELHMEYSQNATPGGGGPFPGQNANWEKISNSIAVP